MKIKQFIFLVFVLCMKFSFGQTNPSIKGYVLDSKTMKPLPFANIYNKTLKQGTISNYDGFFLLTIGSPNDSITITYIGYNKQELTISYIENIYNIALSENTQLLNEVEILINNNSDALYNLIEICKKNTSEFITNSKAYYGLKSYYDTSQVELVEGFYNIKIHGNDIEYMKLKAGRYALKPENEFFFTSISSSRAITLLKLYDETKYFPYSPLNLAKKQSKEKFKLSLTKKYALENKDTIYVIDYTPKEISGLYFSGKLWINNTQKKIIKVNLICDSCIQHPFLPVNTTDSIINVGLNINKTFSDFNTHIIFNHIDFDYTITYKRKPGQRDEKQYNIASKAILYAYDFSKEFNLPNFEFQNPLLNDYRKINSIPYNTFFWKYNNEYKTNDLHLENEKYFASKNHLSNLNFEKTSNNLDVDFKEKPYVPWAYSRITLSKSTIDTTYPGYLINQDNNRYKIAIKIFSDYNKYNDSINILTTTLLDLSETFYLGKLNDNVECFLNIYFDLCEIERLKLEKKLSRKNISLEEYKDIINTFSYNFELFRSNYEQTTSRGYNLKELNKWNTVVLNAIGIDNFQIFNLYNEYNKPH